MIAELSWLIPAVPAVSAALIFLIGKRLPRHGAEIGITAMAATLVLAIAVAAQVWRANVGVTIDPEGGGGAFLLERAVTLAPLGEDIAVQLGMRVDGLAAMMFVLVALVSLMVHIYSVGYMHGDARYTYYFGLLSLFSFSMLLLVIASDLLVLLVGWELVGVCSFLLIGFWWERKEIQDASMKAFLTTKFGDVGLVVAVVALGGATGSFAIGDILEAVEAGEVSHGLLTFALIAMILGVVGKSAQFPLHTWLPDAMAGPTPVSALIHAATMVTAGGFLVARLYPAFHESAAATGTLAVIGAITLITAGLLALVQSDVKKVLAYSTISQLGYMIAGLAFSYVAGVFHLFTHGFFKALLFLGAGSLIHAAGSNHMEAMGGLRRFMPITFWTFLLGSLALIAVPPFAGFWSKDEVLVSALDAGGYTGILVFALGGVGGLITAFYMTRVLYLVFAGQYRGHGQPHESPASMTFPMIVLAVAAVGIGWVNLPVEAVQARAFSSWVMYDLGYWVEHPVEFHPFLALMATVLALAGVLGAWAIYRTYPERDPMYHLGIVSHVLERRYYLDDLYTDLISRTAVRDLMGPAAAWTNDAVLDGVVAGAGRGAMGLGRRLYRTGDQKGLEGVVNGLGVSALWSAARVRLAQSGNVQLYAGAMFVGVVVLAVAFAVGGN
ncbi:MAG: NADH-quinone oxidoreductase subunit L [Actinobacteria bacterium QS_8_72_14]|nr:MAG: NADH-quinone oxidoreductase subunit L [Actinobacteria bacterium QS_8_72_14]